MRHLPILRHFSYTIKNIELCLYRKTHLPLETDSSKGSMSHNGDYEKLQLSKQDLRYIYGQILNNTTSKLDLHLPTSNNDPLKTKVAHLLDDFILDAFEMAKQAIIIDGYDLSGRKDTQPISELLSLKSREKIETFDFELNAKLRDVLENVEKETIQVTKLRRDLPHRARDTYDKLISTTDADVSTILAQMVSPAQELDADNEDMDDSAVIPRLDEIVDDFEATLMRMSDLKKNIPEQKAEMDKLDETIELLETAYRRQEDEAGI